MPDYSELEVRLAAGAHIGTMKVCPEVVEALLLPLCIAWKEWTVDALSLLRRQEANFPESRVDCCWVWGSSPVCWGEKIRQT
eukprot:5471880-Amphidinium_carterae.2